MVHWAQLPEQKPQSWPFWVGLLQLVGVMNVAGRAREFEWPLGSLHGLRQADGLSSFPVTTSVSQSFWVW